MALDCRDIENRLLPAPKIPRDLPQSPDLLCSLDCEGQEDGSLFSQLLPSFDICSWTEEDVFLWMQQLVKSDDNSALQSIYPTLFKDHHITGKRLLLLEERDLKDMGIVSKGHIIHLKTAIERLTHDYLNLFHFPPLTKQDLATESEEEEKIVNLELVFGYHLKTGNSPEDCKWKMYIELDGDEIAITYIKDVTFTRNQPDAEVLRMTKPPFVMEKWIVGISEDESVEYIVSYESDVRTPKLTKHIHKIHWNKMKKQDAVKSVQLAIKPSLLNSERRPSNDSSIDCQWIYTLRMRQMETHRSPQLAVGPRSQSSSLNNLSQILPYLHNQESYAAAVRRTRVKSTLQVTPINFSRSSSPTQFGLTKNVSSLSLQSSKGSSASSTASDSPSEKERARNMAKGGYYHQKGQSYSMQRRSGGKSPQASNGRYYKSYTVAQNHSRSHDYRPHRTVQNQNRHIPGMPVLPSEEVNNDDKVNNDGGWIKVDYSKKNHKQSMPMKPKKDRTKGSSRSYK